MNEALLAAATELVLYLDDDVEPSPGLIGAHERAQKPPETWAVVGQILQPGEEPRHFHQPEDDLEFHFSHDSGRFVVNVMAGNLSVKREHAIAIGGFDENFVGAGYRFETDFALRLADAGGKIWFAPDATLRHLKLSSGGLRSFGDHRTSPSPAHSVGDYYFAIHHRPPLAGYALRRLRRNVVTRYHLRHPWTIPTKLIGELRGMMLARRLARKGRRLLRS
jgi:GT2 family glycosyltransferase